jgi:transposase-like protein
MNLENIFCPNDDCPARGQVGKGNIRSHSKKGKRCRCTECNKTFALTKGTPFYRLRTDPQIVVWVIVLLAYGCPLQAIVKAFGLDERTVKNWHQRAGTHCEAVHDHVIGQAKLDMKQVQADEIKAKIYNGYVWVAMAIMVGPRLWLGGELSPTRNKALLRRLTDRVRSMALCRPLVFAVDGLPGYVRSIRESFRSKMPRDGQAGRCQLISWSDIGIVQVIKRRQPDGLEVERRVVQGKIGMVDRLIQATQSALGGINTSYIERINATFRQRLAPLARRSRHLAQKESTLQAGMWLVGCFYNFCDYHHSLRQRLRVGLYGHTWVALTPAMAAGLSDHRWTATELLTFKVPLPRWTPPKRRGRPSKETLERVKRWC